MWYVWCFKAECTLWRLNLKSPSLKIIDFEINTSLHRHMFLLHILTILIYCKLFRSLSFPSFHTAQYVFICSFSYLFRLFTFFIWVILFELNIREYNIQFFNNWNKVSWKIDIIIFFILKLKKNKNGMKSNEDIFENIITIY